MSRISIFLLSVIVTTACATKTTLVWNEGEPDPETGIAVNELLICNAPEGLEWDLWGHFYEGCKLPCKAVEGTMAQMHLFCGSCWRIEPVQAGDTVVLKYENVRHRQTWHPRGFYLKMRSTGKVIPVDVQYNLLPYEPAAYPEYPNVELKITDIVPAVKYVSQGDGFSTIKAVEESIVSGIRPEGYKLTIADGKAVIEASDERGLRYGQITLAKFKENAGSNTLPDMVVEDWPDFEYRAQMVDVARLYYPIDELKKLVDVLERNKINILALHLNDDENWRLEIDGLPELTSFGAFHEIPVRQADGTYLCEKGVPPVKGSDLGKVWKGTSGYYSREEYIDLIQYAWQRGITVIPEIDIPGHCHSAVEAMKYRERTTGDTSYRLIHPEDSSVYISAQGYHGNVIDIALPSAITFIEKVFDCIVSMYAEAGVPLNEMAVGGDEVADGAWEGSPACIAAMKEKGFTDVNQLRSEFICKVNRMLVDRGLCISGYNEMVETLSPEAFGEIAENCGHIWVWKNLIDPKDAGAAYEIANSGIKVVLATSCLLYFDNARTMAWDDRGVEWAGTLDEKKVYGYLPFNLGASRRFDNNGNPCDITELKPYIPELKHPENIAGIQGMLWGDNLWESTDGFRMMLPKAYGCWERNWNSRPDWEQGTDAMDPAFMEDFIHFFSIVRQRELPFLDAIGLNYWK